ncbi:cell division protein FtsL [Bermanella sp. WJH001]|uniref:cell division protein FtsL n=1 Tax=Bermanella sp. WJH001 TaxID=3048005 RepID=UPI0024BD6AB1|nr:cell division protein FtsL [Bermanella sp. WJH001]MDJ1537910.1 cell division protein FtsL [Bermanella sp. WJH001]
MKNINVKWVFLVLMVSAVAVVYTSYANRQLAHQWQKLGNEYSQLQEEYGRLMLEYSTLAAPSRVEVIARQTLDMQFPDKLNTRVIEVHEFLKNK